MVAIDVVVKRVGLQERAHLAARFTPSVDERVFLEIPEHLLNSDSIECDVLTRHSGSFMSEIVGFYSVRTFSAPISSNNVSSLSTSSLVFASTPSRIPPLLTPVS